jgi:uncharacterized membrane protein
MAFTNTNYAGRGPSADSHTPSTGSSRVNVGKAERIISVAGGALLALLAVKDFRRNKAGSIAMLTSGGSLLFRGATGYCPINESVGRTSAASTQVEPVEVSQVLTINKPRHQVYAYWRKLENLPRFMEHLREVRQIDNKRSHWEAFIPKMMGPAIQWDAQITSEEKDRRIAWRSIANATVDNAGEVGFEDAPDTQATQMHVKISYHPPAGDLGKGVAKLFNPMLESMIKADLMRFKQIMETGRGELTRNAVQTPGNVSELSSTSNDLNVSTTDIRNTIAGSSAEQNR